MRVVYALSLLLLLYLSLPAISALMSLSPAEISTIDPSPVLTSLLSATLTTAIATVLGVPLAYRLSRMEGKFRPIFEAVILTPIVLPPIASGLLMLKLLSPSGLIGSVSDLAGLKLTRSFAGVVLAQLIVASPFLVISSKAGFDAVDRRLEYASRLMGKSEFQTFLRVSVPLARKSIIAGVMMCFVRSFGEFGATFMLAYHPKTLPIELYTYFLSGGVEKASAVAVVFWFVSLLFVLMLRREGGRVA
ncbi:molybdate ABC transporter permease subunit [Geoglobus ahangari]